MTVENVKDTQRLEVTRFIEADDPVFFSTTNRPLEDVEQRTRDLDRIMSPARGFRVRQTASPSTTVEVETGFYVVGTTVNKPSLQTVGPIPAASAGFIRVDLIYINLSTGVAARVAGNDTAAGSGFAAARALVNDLPSGTPAAPLAYVYVDEFSTAYDRTIAINTAGHIEDARTSPGVAQKAFESSGANILSDVTGGSVGSVSTVARANHRHPLNVDATNPVQITANSTGSPGAAGTYSRRDHSHSTLVETVGSNLLTDSGSGVVGTSASFVRADHRHPLNISVNPGDLLADVAGGSLGASVAYSRSDHQHPLNVPVGGSPATLNPNTSATHGASGTYSRSDHIHALTGLLQVNQTGSVSGEVYFGEIDALATITNSGSGGWTVASGGTGVYNINFSPILPGTPVAVVTPRTPSRRPDITVATTSQVRVTIFNTGTGTPINTDFMFMVMAT